MYTQFAHNLKKITHIYAKVIDKSKRDEVDKLEGLSYAGCLFSAGHAYILISLNRPFNSSILSINLSNGKDFP